MSEETIYTANPGKQLIRTVDGVDYQRIPIKTHLITKADRMEDVVLQYAGDKMQEGDILFISEKAVACTQSRAIPMEDIKPRKLAVTLSRYVTKTPAGIGLGIPETMEMALQECGTLRILFAAFCSVIGKLFHQRGWFYIVAGPKARGIDGPTEGTIPPYDHYVVLTPDDPNGTARKLDTALGHPDDLSKDISEHNNLVEHNKELTDELLNKLHHWRIEVNATMPTKNPLCTTCKQ